MEGVRPPREKEAYKLPHHELIEGRLRVVWSGVRSAMQMLAGARGDVRIPASDRQDVYRQPEKHYREFHKQPPGFEELGSS